MFGSVSLVADIMMITNAYSKTYIPVYYMKKSIDTINRITKIPIAILDTDQNRMVIHNIVTINYWVYRLYRALQQITECTLLAVTLDNLFL